MYMYCNIGLRVLAYVCSGLGNAVRMLRVITRGEEREIAIPQRTINESDEYVAIHC
jgi:hypothetical protein